MLGGVISIQSMAWPPSDSQRSNGQARQLERLVHPRPQGLKQDSNPGALMALPLSELAAHPSMPATETGQHLSAKLSLFGRVLHCQACQFVGFLDGNLLAGGGTCAGIHNVHQRRTPVGEPCDNRSNPTGVQRPQSGIDSGQCLAALGGQSGVLQVALGDVDRPHRMPRRTDSTAHWLEGFSNYIAGLAVFEGSLARPVQGTRYRSRSKSLPLSRSSQ